MDENIINQYAFEIFSRAKILKIEFNIFEAEQRLERARSEKSEEITLIIIESQVNQHKQELEKLKSQLEKFREQKQINK